MKILHVTPGIYEGGVATLIYDLCKYQVQRGEDVTILCTRDNYLQRSKQVFFENESINVIFLPNKSVYNPLCILQFRKIIKQYDIVHVHLFPNQFYVSLAKKLLTRSKQPIIITTEHNTFNNRRKYALAKLFDRWFYKKYDAIVGISPQATHNLVHWLNTDFKNTIIKTIVNGIDLDKFIKVNEDHVSNDISLIMVARLSYPKDPLTLVRALPLCSQNVKIVFVGTGPLSKEIDREAKHLNISNRINMLGNRTDVPKLLSHSTIGILSTNWDGFGLVAVEYMATGLPILASDVEGLRDVVGNKKYLFKTGDHIDLANKINQLLDNSYLYSEAVKYSKNRAQQFSEKTMNKQYLDLYYSLIQQKQYS